MKKTMLLTAIAIVLISIIFCGCDNHKTAVFGKEETHESISATVAETESTSAKSTATENKATDPTVLKQISTEPTETYEGTEAPVIYNTPCDYSTDESTQPAETFYENAQPLYVSDYVYSDVELEVFELINQERINAGVNPLTLSYVYADCAHIRAMEADVVWSHTRPDGSSFDTVLYEYNLQDSYLLIGENLASGMSSAVEAMNGLMNSPGHRANILRPEYTTVAVSAVEMSEYPGYYVIAQIFVSEK